MGELLHRALTGSIGAFVLLAALAGCAAPRAAGPGPAGPPTSAALSASPPPVVAPPPADSIPSYSLVKEDPAIVTASRSLDAAGTKARPALLLARAREAIAAGQKIRAEQGTLINLPGWAPGYERFRAFYDLASRDLEELAGVYPNALEAPEGRYLLGLICDYPHLDLFDEALAQYRLTVERYPGTPWAALAAKRVELIEAILRASFMSPGSGTPEEP